MQLPKDDAVALWSLQQTLLSMAEHLLGPRDSSKKIYQPIFSSAGPFICNTPNMDGAFAELSLNAAGYWPTAVFELAHETVHLLNPIAGGTNFLEEGIAVAFSQFAMERYGLKPPEPGIASYAEALRLVRLLPTATFAAGRKVRMLAGSLGNATPENMGRLFPTADPAILGRLTRPFPLRENAPAKLSTGDPE